MAVSARTNPQENVAPGEPRPSVGSGPNFAATNSPWGLATDLPGTSPAGRRPQTPDEVLVALAEGNKRFARCEAIAPHRSMTRLREVSAVQSPFAVVLGCADSRVPVEIIFDQGFGDVFVTRIAGNVATPETIGSLEFGAHVLGAKVIYVLGHTACGAVTAAMKDEAVPGQIGALLQHVRPAVKSSGHDLDRAVCDNVIHQAKTIAEASPVIAALLAEGKLKIAGGVYDLATGIVTTLPV